MPTVRTRENSVCAICDSARGEAVRAGESARADERIRGHRRLRQGRRRRVGTVRRPELSVYMGDKAIADVILAAVLLPHFTDFTMNVFIDFNMPQCEVLQSPHTVCHSRKTAKFRVESKLTSSRC